jgi:c-di-GMP-related signal transduction protein
MDLFIGRQPILDTGKHIIGYELLFRNSSDNYYSAKDGREATLTVIGATLFHMGIKNMVGNKKAFINFTRDLLIEHFSDILPKEKVVIEILESIILDQEAVAVCADLKTKGYTIALDDVVSYERCVDVMEYIDIVKVDWALTREDEKIKIAEKLIKQNITLLAEKIETHEDFERAKDYGYKLFQGYFFSRPTVLSTQAIPSGFSTGIKLIQEFNRTDLTIEEASELIKEEPVLAFNLLKYLNSAAFGFKTRISGITQALMLIGITNMRRWIVTLIISQTCKHNPAIVNQAVERARFCEILAPLFSIESSTEELFMVGLLSLGEVLLQQDMRTILKTVNVAKKVEDTLLNEVTDYTPLLKVVEAQEASDWELLGGILNSHKISRKEYLLAFEEVVEWGNARLANDED